MSVKSTLLIIAKIVGNILPVAYTAYRMYREKENI